MVGLSDTRKFARIILGKQSSVLTLPQIAGLGPDPLLQDFTPQILAKRLEKNGPIKKVLLDQTVIAGIGNIYSDEILFRAGIHPLRPANEMAKASKKLLEIMRKTLREGIRRGGASKTNYRNPRGEMGGFMGTCLVYGRAGKPCFTCKTPIKKLTVGGRTASFCPACQRLTP
jgi:formamidopyrimidine-DNA glycosylase